MLGYDLCLSCGLYHQSTLDKHSCESSQEIQPQTLKHTLSKLEYESLYEKRLKVILYFLRPTLPSYPSDVFDS
jgi:hypothetical protein